MGKISLLSAADAGEAKRAVLSLFDTEVSAGHLEQFLGSDTNYLWIARDGDEITGMLLAYKLTRIKDEGCKLFIYEIEVSPEHRRKGIGRALVAEALRTANAIGAAAVFGITDHGHRGAIEFYRATGAEVSRPDKTLFHYFAKK